MKKKSPVNRTYVQKGLAILSVLSTMAIALSGCSGDKAADSSDESVTLTVGIAQDLDGLDPHNVQAAGTREVLFNIFEGLVKPDEEGNLNPALASEISISDDATEYTFTLRDGVKFHNGKEVTAEDVKYSLERYKDTGASSFEDVQAIDIVDDDHIKVTLGTANTEFLSLMTVAIIPADLADPDKEPIGTGPYKFVSRSPQENVIVEKFDDYWDSANAAHIKDVVFKVEANPDSIVMDLEGGSIDMMPRVTSTQASQLSDSFKIYEGQMNLVQALYLNNAVAPFDNELVRQAMCYAVDPEEIMDFVSDGAGFEIGSAMFPSFGKYFDESLNDTYNYDPDKAKELLAEAGYADGFSFTITVPSNYTQHIDTAEVIAEELQKVGIKAEISQIEWNSWLEDVYGGKNYEATVIGFDASTLCASALLYRYTSDAHNNMFNYANADYDAAFKAAQSTTDDAEQVKYYKECEKILSETAAAVYIQDLPEFVAMSDKFEGYTFYPLYAQDIAKIRLADGE
ncbi:ABC transporter substrate-binding protein [Butyrivibrio sp. MC2013]|uniref:ABC transporter substrate-binding protein n=1 Tax=Butyrivibrio sp. MC2013 TaxID=1280686 RepID=UPI00040D62BE|nr:ABC transporter substrate-binding protein [Butyrivibrio sp. MC2013]